MSRAERALGAGLRASASLLLAALLLLVGANVAGRLLGLPEIAWVGEVVELLFAWAVFLAAAEAWRTRGHFAVDLLADSLPGGRPRRAARLLVCLLALAFLLLLAWHGARLTLLAGALSPILGWPTSLWYAAVPVAAGLMALASARDALLLLAGRDLPADPAT